MRVRVRVSIVMVVLLVAGLAIAGESLATTASDPKVLTIVVPTEPVHLDPQNFSESIAHSIILHVHNGPMKFNKDFNLIPDLAESVKVAVDGLTWTIKLKEGIKFHDGTPLTAEAIKLIVDNAIGDDPPIRSAYVGRADLESARIINDHVVEMKTSSPVGPFRQMLSCVAWAVNSPAAFEKYGEEASRHPVGTGPYRFAEWKSGEYIALERNPDYFGEQPYYDRLVWRFVPEALTRVAMLESGEVDVVVAVPALEIPRLQDNPGITVEPVELNRNMYIAINCQRPFLDDKRVRQALNYAVDKEAIIDGILRGLGKKEDSPMCSPAWGYRPTGEYPYDPDKARQLLAEAGVPADFRIKLWIPSGRYYQDKTVGEAVANYLVEVGLDVDLQEFEWGTYLGMIRKPVEEAQHELYMLGWTSVTMDADLSLTGILHSNQWPMRGTNRGYYKNAAVDALLDAGRRCVNEEDRKQIYAEAQKIIWEDAPWIFLHEQQQVIAYRKGISGIYMWPTEALDLLDAKEE